MDQLGWPGARGRERPGAGLAADRALQRVGGYDAFALPGVVTRMFNNYGPRQNPRYVTGTIITQALTRETVELGALERLGADRLDRSRHRCRVDVFAAGIDGGRRCPRRCPCASSGR